jgi:hypothetical protein
LRFKICSAIFNAERVGFSTENGEKSSNLNFWTLQGMSVYARYLSGLFYEVRENSNLHLLTNKKGRAIDLVRPFSAFSVFTDQAMFGFDFEKL